MLWPLFGTRTNWVWNETRSTMLLDRHLIKSVAVKVFEGFTKAALLPRRSAIGCPIGSSRQCSRREICFMKNVQIAIFNFCRALIMSLLARGLSTETCQIQFPICTLKSPDRVGLCLCTQLIPSSICCVMISNFRAAME